MFMFRIIGMYNGRKFSEVVTMEERMEIMRNPYVTIFSIECI